MKDLKIFKQKCLSPKDTPDRKSYSIIDILDIYVREYSKHSYLLSQSSQKLNGGTLLKLNIITKSEAIVFSYSALIYDNDEHYPSPRRRMNKIVRENIQKRMRLYRIDKLLDI